MNNEQSNAKIKLIECPRDAMQGIKTFIPTEKKIKYLNLLLQVGFDTIDFGSFVSPKFIPQLSDTHDVVKKLDLSNSKTKLLAIVANLKGAADACLYDEIKYLGFPFSISETFQIKNINATIKESLGRVEDIQIVLNICEKFKKEMVVYISMAFGNPYGDSWSEDLVYQWVEKLTEMGIKTISLSDTIGISNGQSISKIFSEITKRYPEIEFGAHFHTDAISWEEKIDAAYVSGCYRFDGAINGFGGCPLTGKEMIGNMATENIIGYFVEKKVQLNINFDRFYEAMQMANGIFSNFK